jgi:CRP/FNR family transcriptional regulator, cyclic AMP receptor protein
MNTTNSPWAPDASVFGALIPQAPRPGEDYWNRAHPAKWAKVLAEFPLFAGVPKRRLRKLVTHAVPLEYVAGETVVWVGDPGDSLFVILSGSAKAQGKPAAQTLKIGDYFGELALVDQSARSATVVATSELHVMRIPRRAVLGLAKQYPTISLRMVGGLGSQIRRLESRLAHA